MRILRGIGLIIAFFARLIGRILDALLGELFSHRVVRIFFLLFALAMLVQFVPGAINYPLEQVSWLLYNTGPQVLLLAIVFLGIAYIVGGKPKSGGKKSR